MTNFDCPNKQTRTPIGTRMLPHVNMDVPDHQRRRRPYNPCGRVRKLKEKTTLEPHDCSKMVRKELSPIIAIGASREPSERRLFWSFCSSFWRSTFWSCWRNSRNSVALWRLSTAGLPWPPLLKSDLLKYRQCKVQNDLLLINHKPNFFKPWFIQLTEICVVI